MLTRDELDELMSFDHVIRVDEDGNVTEPSGVYGPEAVYVESEGEEPVVEKPWTLLSGWSLQWMYQGPIMDDSEGIHGPMAEHIQEVPGYYVATYVTYLNAGEKECEECDAGPGEDCASSLEEGIPCPGLEDRENLILVLGGISQ